MVTSTQSPTSFHTLIYNPQNSKSLRSIAEMNEELTTFIIKELGKPVDRQEIIRRVCKKGGLHWKEAERLVILIEARYRRATPTRQTTLLLFLSLAALLLGIGFLAYNLEILLVFFQKVVLGETLRLKGSHSIELLSGFGMTVGGMIGLWKALGSIFPN